VGDADAYAVAIAGVLGGLVGSRVFHVIDAWSYYAAHPEQIVAVWNGGAAVTGGIVVGIVGGFAMARARELPIAHVLDRGVAGLALGMAIGRIGDVINGEHHAIACDGGPGICVAYTHPDTLGQGPLLTGSRYSPGPVHLAVGYDLVWDALSVVVALWLRRRGLPDGTVFWIWALQYAVGRFVLGFFRVGDPTHVFGLRQDQVIALLVMAAALPMLARLTSRARPATRALPA